MQVVWISSKRRLHIRCERITASAFASGGIYLSLWPLGFWHSFSLFLYPTPRLQRSRAAVTLGGGFSALRSVACMAFLDFLWSASPLPADSGDLDFFCPIHFVSF